MNTHHRLLIATCAAVLALLPTPAAAQQPVPVGTAAGYGLGAMTEARSAESALWNPALSAIFDGPVTTVSWLAISAEPGLDRSNVDLFRSLGWVAERPVERVDGALLDAIRRWTASGPLASARMNVAVQWVGIQSRDLTISLSSYGYGRIEAPHRAVAIMMGDREAAFGKLSESDIALAMDGGTGRLIATTLAVAKGADLGTLPLLGRTWGGATFKGSILHSHAIGQVRYVAAETIAGARNTEPGEIGVALSELVLQNARTYGVDIGVVANPWAPLLVSATASNIFQLSQLSGIEDVRFRALGFAGIDSTGAVRVYDEREVARAVAEERLWTEEAEFIARGSHFTPVVRIGGSLETHLGRLFGGVTLPVEEGYAVDRHTLEMYSFGWQSLGSMRRARISYSQRLDGSAHISAGMQYGYCADRLAISGGYLRRPGERGSATMSISWSRGSGQCGLIR